jgi:hypothetical protein
LGAEGGQRAGRHGLGGQRAHVIDATHDRIANHQSVAAREGSQGDGAIDRFARGGQQGLGMGGRGKAVVQAL